MSENVCTLVRYRRYFLKTEMLANLQVNNFLTFIAGIIYSWINDLLKKIRRKRRSVDKDEYRTHFL